MFCRNCGQAFREESSLCGGCGAPSSALASQGLPDAIPLPDRVDSWCYAGPGIATRRPEVLGTPYQTCSSLGISVGGALHRQPVELLAEAVARVVAIEGPVHLDEAVRRVRKLWGVKRAGQRIQQAINRAVSFAERNAAVVRRGAFLWPAGMGAVPVRRRHLDPPPRIDLICDEEIAGAATLLLAHHAAATDLDGIVIDCLRLFGVQTATGLAATRIRGIVLRLIELGLAERTPDGRIRRVPSP